MRLKNILKKDLFSNYHPILVAHLLKTIIQTSLILNILIPIIFISLSYNYIPINYIYIWIILNLMIFIFRLYLKKKIFIYVKQNNLEKLNTIVKYYIMCIVFTSILLISYIYLSLHFKLEHSDILLMVIIIIAISAGAVTSLATIFIGYLLFISLNLISLSLILIIADYNTYILFSLTSFILYLALIPLGFRNFETISNAIYSHETFKTIYDKTTDGIALIKNNRFMDCNESIIRMFNYASKDEFLNTHISKLIPRFQADKKNSIKKMLNMIKIANDTNNNSFEWLHIKKDGSEFWTEIVLTKIYLNGEHLIHGIWRDISQRKELENIKEKSKKEIEKLNLSLQDKVEKTVKVLREKDKILYEQSKLASMGEMIGNIAHQWRQPLSIISTLATSTSLNKELQILNDEKLFKNMDLINENAQYLSKTIDDFRNFIKSDSNLIKFNLKDNIQNLLNLTVSSVKKENIHIILNLEDNISILGHSNELIQCYLNLFNNSKDALESLKEKNKYIFISTFIKYDKVHIIFKDNAGGLPQNIIQKVFEPYFTTKHKSRGTGIGLNMTYQIIQKMNGSIEAYNETFTYEDIQYTGAVFEIILPKT